LIRSRGLPMQRGFQPNRPRPIQNRVLPVHPSQRLHVPIVKVGITGCLSLLFALSGFSARGQQTQAPDAISPNPEPSPAEILPLESSRPILRVGSQGAPVSELQALLKLLGYYTGAVDGVYQESTAIAVTAFQRAAGLAADGVTGPSTWSRLLPASPLATNAATPSVPSPAASDEAETTAATLAFPSPSPAGAIATPTADSPSPTGAVDSTPTASATSATGDAPPADTPANATQTSSPEAQSTSVDLPILRVGMRGPAVSRLQERLRATGFFNGAIDGVFGSETQSAVRAAQRSFNLDPDGVVGPATWTALLR
jgi:N-acetylmuramoyl-L-alanine amidase